MSESNTKACINELKVHVMVKNRGLLKRKGIEERCSKVISSISR